MSQPNTFNYDREQFNSESDSLLNGEVGVSLNSDPIANNSLPNSIKTIDESETNSLALEGNSSTPNDEAGLKFVFNFADNVPQEIKDNIIKAGAVWSSVISNDVTVQIDVGFELETDGLANADSETIEVSYAEFRQALNDNATSENDAIAIANLPDDGAVDFLINNTKENQGSDDVYLDDNDSANNSTVKINTATAQVLGFDVPEDIADATITFDQNVNWDYDAEDGVAVNAIDFESVAIHEIGHVLGLTG